MNNNVKLSVRELVEFVYSGGDISSVMISNKRALEGIKAHQILQSSMGENYEKEFFLKYETVFQNINFIIEGRADGIIKENNIVTIDEIKSTYTKLEFIDENFNEAHIAQVKCYAYIYATINFIENINVQLRYYNLDTKEIKIIVYKLSIEELQKFFINLLEKYLDWAKLIIDLKKEREVTIKNLEFPFQNYRDSQRQFCIAVFKTIKEKKKLFVQAPTGVGKTVSVLFPSIKAMMDNKRSKIYYLTAKSSTKDIAYDTIKLMIAKGLKLRVLVITAKDKICFNDKISCEPENCQYAVGYYNKVNDVLKKCLKNNYLFNREYIEKIARENNMCPFELSLDLGYMSDVVICDYNYYFDPRVALKRDDFYNKTEDILLIDEAHNLEERTRSMYSPEISKEEFYEVYKIEKEKSKNNIVRKNELDVLIDEKVSIRQEKLDIPMSEYSLSQNTNKNILKQLKEVNKNFINIKKDLNESKILEEPKELLKSLRKFITEAEKYINESKNQEISKEFMEIYFKSIFFVKISEIVDENFCYYTYFIKSKCLVKILLKNTSDILKSILNTAHSSILFSATLTPLKYFKYLLGGEDVDYTLRLNSSFEQNNLKLLIASDISMKYEVRDLNIPKVCEYINCLINSYEGNYMVFFPSYSYLNKVSDFYVSKYENNIIVQNESLNEESQKDIVYKFKNEKNVIMFTVVGGSFSEGIDLPLEELIGVIIIGTGIPQINFERDIIKSFFDEKFNQGFDFAYKYPGFNKILQSAGRVIRTEKDRGVVFLIDSRLSQNSYTKLYPVHWSHYEKVYSTKELIKKIQYFKEECNDTYSF